MIFRACKISSKINKKTDLEGDPRAEGLGKALGGDFGGLWGSFLGAKMGIKMVGEGVLKGAFFQTSKKSAGGRQPGRPPTGGTTILRPWGGIKGGVNPSLGKGKGFFWKGMWRPLNHLSPSGWWDSLNFLKPSWGHRTDPIASKIDEE